MENLKKEEMKPASPRTTQKEIIIPKKPMLQKQMSQKANCLCSPTTHSGSFRCRYHRNSFRRSSVSIGSGLSDLANKVELPATASDDSFTKV